MSEESGRQTCVAMGNSGSRWESEDRVVEGRVKGPPKEGLPVAGGPCLTQTSGGVGRVRGGSGEWLSPYIASAGLRTLSQAPAGEILNSSGRVRGRNSLNLAQPLSSPIP